MYSQIALGLYLTLASPAAINHPQADTIVVCPAEFQPALTPWLEYRGEQGHRFAFVENTQSAEAIRTEIRGIAKGGTAKHLLLVGDANGDVKERTTPTHLIKAKVNVFWGSEPEIASDNIYADLDDDGLPDLTVGRLTADTPSELSVMVDKILQYEQSLPQTDWRRRINFIAGVGGFSPLADTVLEMATKKFMVDSVPAGFDTSMTYASWRSPYCPPPAEFRDFTIGRFNEGCLFWVYIGHGQRTYLDAVTTPAGRHPIFSVLDMDKINCKEGSPIAIFFACYTGAFDEPRDCIAEELLAKKGGPVASISGSRVTMPYAMSVMADELLTDYFVERRPLLGEVIMQAKRRSLDPPKKENANRLVIDALASAISPKPELLEEERREHLHLFNLFGDPLLRLPHPESLGLNCEDTVTAGESLTVKGTTPIAGECTIEFICRRDRTREPIPTRREYVDNAAEMKRYAERYDAANNIVWSRFAVETQSGEFKFNVTAPLEARGPCHVRVFVAGKEKVAVDAVDVFVRSPRRK